MTFNCDLNQGYSLECSSVGGVEAIWLAKYDPTMDWLPDSTTNYISVPVFNGTPGPTMDFYKINQRPEFAEFTQDGVYSVENGTTAYETKLSMRFIHLNNDLRNLLSQIGRAPLVAIVKSTAGDYFIAGVELAGYASEGKAGVGKSMTDLNGADLTIMWKSMEGSFLVDPLAADGTLVGSTIAIDDSLETLVLPTAPVV